jgi:hypothetical protein
MATMIWIKENQPVVIALICAVAVVLIAAMLAGYDLSWIPKVVTDLIARIGN